MVVIDLLTHYSVWPVLLTLGHYTPQLSYLRRRLVQPDKQVVVGYSQ